VARSDEPSEPRRLRERVGKRIRVVPTRISEPTGTITLSTRDSPTKVPFVDERSFTRTPAATSASSAWYLDTEGSVSTRSAPAWLPTMSVP
jgi:hypothetical protein